MKQKNVKEIVNEGWKGLVIDVEMKNKEWLDKCWVWILANLSMYDRIDEVFAMDGCGEIKFRYLGGDLGLIFGLLGETANIFVPQENKTCYIYV